MEVNCVEQSLDVDLAFLSRSIQKDLDAASGDQFAVQRLRVLRIRVVKEKLFRNFIEGGIEKDILPVKYDYGVDDVLEVPYLMGGNEQSRVFGSIFHDRFPELCLRRYVQPVCRLVHEEILAVAGKRKGNV